VSRPNFGYIASGNGFQRKRKPIHVLP